MDDDLIPLESRFKLLVSNRPWEHEPHYETWVDEATGYECEIRRHPTLWSLNGYVTVPNGHPLYGRECDTINSYVNVHGGVTFASEGTIGFDCNHTGDFSPKMVMNLMQLVDIDPQYHVLNDEYRDWAYVKAEVTKLAEQLKQLKVKEK